MFESAGLVIIAIWALIIILIGIGFLVANVKLFWYLIKRNRLAKEHVLMVKQQTELKYNKIATMTASDFDTYLINIFSIQMQITTDTDISENDPDGIEKLYFNTAKRMIAYLGPETMDAIDFFYGANYIYRWCEMHYLYLNRKGKLHAIIKAKDMESDAIANSLKNK